MKRKTLERNYWNTASHDPDIDSEYICHAPKKDCIKAVGKLSGRVLEIGCGIGRLMKDGYYGIDIADGMIKIAKNKKPSCHIELSDGRTIPFDDNYFDAVYSVLVFQHIPYSAVMKYISETARVLKPKGKFVFQFIEGDENAPFSKHHKLEKVLKVLKSNGFDEIKVKSKLIHDAWTWIYTEKA